MFRVVVVIWIVGLMLADPIVCRVEVATSACAATCRAGVSSRPTQPCPARHHHDSTHGCICQGATPGQDARSHLTEECQGFHPAPAFLPKSTGYGLSLAQLVPGRRFSASQPLGVLSGRRLRVERQSLLF